MEYEINEAEKVEPEKVQPKKAEVKKKVEPVNPCDNCKIRKGSVLCKSCVENKE